jgi:FAD/FMN-containing dehydrogenase
MLKLSQILFLLFFASTHAKLSKNCTSTMCEVLRCIQQQSPNITIILPQDDGYNDMRIGVNFRYDKGFPHLIVKVVNEGDVIASLVCSESIGRVRVTVMNGGHSFEGLSTTENEQQWEIYNENQPSNLKDEATELVYLLLHLDLFSNVLDFDEKSQTITVQSGMRLGRLYGNIVQYGQGNLALGAGTCETVGVVGHVLCGGYGMLGRYVGFTSDQVIRFHVARSSGDIIPVSETENPNLFWALRGGCSSIFGVIVDATFQLTQLPSPNVTTVSLPEIYGWENVTNVALWFQKYAPFKAPEVFTGL